jgi:crossover junction endodeoxyribonuclease RusA
MAGVREMICLTLPLPPTINHYYGQRRNGGRFIKPAGEVFRKAVSEIVADAGHKTLEGRISLFAAIYPANRIKQDLDNRSKALQDALTHAGVWLDDEQIDELHLIRKEVIKGGLVKVVITEGGR